MFVEMYKAGGHWSRSNSEKIIKIVVNKIDMEMIKSGIEKLMNTELMDDRYLGFKNHILNDWKQYTPYTDTEKEAFKDEPAYILKLYERDFENVTYYWCVLLSVLSMIP